MSATARMSLVILLLAEICFASKVSYAQPTRITPYNGIDYLRVRGVSVT
jgi:hypothetical protein